MTFMQRKLPDVIASCCLPELEFADHKSNQIGGHLKQKTIVSMVLLSGVVIIQFQPARIQRI
jgi:hypothetical protein